MADKPKTNFAPKPKIDGKIYRAISIQTEDPVPANVIETLVKVAEFSVVKGFTVRVGAGAVGEAIKGAVRKDHVEQHAPWEGFKDSKDIYTKATNHAKAIAMRFQKGLNGAKPFAWALAGVQVNSLLGKDVRSPADVLLVWTPCGTTLATGPKLARFSDVKLALRIANYMSIPVFNAKSAEDLKNLKAWLAPAYPDFEEGEWDRELFKFVPKK